ncbi:MAG: HNH endonuclease [Candidatus Helarchaeota archaeon]
MQIFQVFVARNFEPLTIQEISKALKIDSNTITQRINRNERFFDVLNKRPKKIRPKEGIDVLIFLKDGNRCQICQEKLPNDLLITRPRKPNIPKPRNYYNLITVCQKCKDKPLPKRLGKSRSTLKVKKSEINGWEYKQIRIIKREEARGNQAQFYPMMNLLGNPEFYMQMGIQIIIYYEYNELDGKGWFHLIDNDNPDDIISRTIPDILNEFGDKGWELVFMREINSTHQMQTVPYTIVSSNMYNQQSTMEEYECILKRKKRRKTK